MATETETRPSTDSKPEARPPPRPRKPAPPDVCRLTLAIRGVTCTVRLLAADAGADVARLIPLRRSGDSPATYHVALTAHGATCDCGDQTFRHEGRETACKHIRACRALGLLPSLAAKGGPR